MSDTPTLYSVPDPNTFWPPIQRLIDKGALVPVKPNLDGMRRIWDALAPCVCGPEYTDRKLESPHCWNHVTRGELLDLWNGALEVTDDE